MTLGAIQPLCGQEEGEGGQKKSTLVHPGEGMSTWTKSLNLAISESIFYTIALCTGFLNKYIIGSLNCDQIYPRTMLFKVRYMLIF